MSSSALEVVEQIYDAFGRRDVPKVLSLFSPDIQIVQSQELPWGGTYRGHAGAVEFFGKLTARINSTVTIDRFVSAAETVVVIGWTTGTVKATGASYHVPIAHILSVREGLVAHIQFYVDHPTMLAALTMGSEAGDVPPRT
jgi:uncharacterized protein